MKLGKNYTKPNLPNHEDNPKDWLASSLIFSKTISHLLKPNEGIVIELENDMKLLMPDYDKVVVYNDDKQIKIMECNEDIEEGQMVWLHSQDDHNCECNECKCK